MSTTVSRTIVPAGTWNVDPAHSSVSFAVKHMGIATVRGAFRSFQGAIDATGGSPVLTGTVDVASIDTGEEQRDAHLRSADFFDVEQHPEISFDSTRIEPIDDDSFRITGNLTLHGITREIELQGEVQGTDTDPWGNERVGLEITGQLSRGEYGMKFNQALGSGNMLVGDKVKLALDISAVKAS